MQPTPPSPPQPQPAPRPTSQPTPRPTPAGKHPSQTLTLRVRSAVDLIAVAPVMLGFHPEESVVLLTTEGERSFHARADLPESDAAPEDVLSVAALLVGAARRNQVRTLALLFFGDDERAVQPLWRALRRGCRQAGVEVLAAVRVESGRYYPLTGARRQRETGIPYNVDDHPFLAEAVLQGMVVERDRDRLVASGAPDRARQAAVLAAGRALDLLDAGPPTRQSRAERRQSSRWVRELVTIHVEAGSTPTDEEAARLLWALRDDWLYETAWEVIRLASRPPSLLRACEAFWLDLLRRAPDEVAAAPATLFAAAAYRAGHGAHAWIGIERCWEVDAHDPMARLLAGHLERAMPPEVLDEWAGWDELARTQFEEEEVLHG